MISKNYDLKSFKNKAAQTSDFLKSKGYDIPKTTLLHSLSLFMGEKNWNTMQATLKKENIKDSDKPSTVDLNVTTVQGFLGGASSISKDSSHIYKFLQHDYSLATLKQLANQLGFSYTDDKDLAFCLPHLDSISKKIENIEGEIYFKQFILSFSDCAPEALSIHNDKQIMYTDVKNPYDYFLNGLVHKYQMIGDEFIIENNFVFHSSDNQHSSIFFFSVAIILFSGLNKTTPGFLNHILLKIRARDDKMNITIYSFTDQGDVIKSKHYEYAPFSEPEIVNFQDLSISFEKGSFHFSRTDRFI